MSKRIGMRTRALQYAAVLGEQSASPCRLRAIIQRLPPERRPARAYGPFIKRHPEQSITPVSCLAHISRKFKETRTEHPRIAARILLLIGTIYQVKKRLDERNADPLSRQRTRSLESR